MVEIKFRAKYKDPNIKEWAYGSLDKTEWDSPCFKYSLSNFFRLLEQGFLDPETVGRFARKDNSEPPKEVYEGDVIEGTVYYGVTKESRPDLWDKYVVKFGYGDVDASDYEEYEVTIIGFYLVQICRGQFNYTPPSIAEIRTFKVIDNISENPKLLEETK